MSYIDNDNRFSDWRVDDNYNNSTSIRIIFIIIKVTRNSSLGLAVIIAGVTLIIFIIIFVIINIMNINLEILFQVSTMMMRIIIMMIIKRKTLR